MMRAPAAETVWGVRADLSCLLCSRTIGTATRADGSETVAVSPVRPEHADALRRLRCPYCGGAIFRGAPETVALWRRPLTPEEIEPPKAGRPKRARATRRYPCAGCGTPDVVVNRGFHCRPCNARRRTERAGACRLVLYLRAAGDGVHRDRLCAYFGISRMAFRHIVRRARSAGYRITRHRHYYRLEAAP